MPPGDAPLVVNTEALHRASLSLRGCADHLEAVLAAQQGSLSPAAAGREEVSGAVAAWAGAAAATVSAQVSEAVARLRTAADTLARQAGDYTAQDGAVAAALGAR